MFIVFSSCNIVSVKHIGIYGGHSACGAIRTCSLVKLVSNVIKHRYYRLPLYTTRFPIVWNRHPGPTFPFLFILISRLQDQEQRWWMTRADLSSLAESACTNWRKNRKFNFSLPFVVKKLDCVWEVHEMQDTGSSLNDGDMEVPSLS